MDAKKWTKLNFFKKNQTESKKTTVKNDDKEPPKTARNRRFNPTMLAEFVNRNSKWILIASLMLLFLIIVTVGLSLFLTIGKDIIFLQAKCPDGINTPKIDCLSNVDQQQATNQPDLKSMCLSKGCCWIGDSDMATPNCVYPYNLGYKNKKYKENIYSRYWIDLLKLESQAEYTNAGINNLEAKVEMQTDYRIHVKIYPRRNFKNKVQRWEIPSGINNENVNRPNYQVKLNENPFSIEIRRNNSGQIIFDTSKSSLVFNDNFLQLTTTLSSPILYGIGENSKSSFFNGVSYRTWTMFASNNHPHEALENDYLYSQLPMYLNIEPDGQCHLVVFYNSNAGEIYLTPFPSLTYRAIGGIFDIYIFMGPTPIEAIAQFQQAFGLPKLPPYWSLGLQIGSSNYGTLKDLKLFKNAFKNASIPFDSISIDTEYMADHGMFTLSPQFKGLSEFVDELRSESRTSMIKFTPGIMNHSMNYPYTDGKTSEKLWIMENFFSKPFVGKLLGRHVVYPDFDYERTREWWKEALQRFVVKDEMVKLDGVFIDYSAPVNENPVANCQSNKWNSPSYKPRMTPKLS